MTSAIAFYDVAVALHVMAILIAIVGVLVATNLFLVLQLSHPFIGDVATSPDPLREAVAVLEQPSG